jgi:hypothetical protein
VCRRCSGQTHYTKCDSPVLTTPTSGASYILSPTNVAAQAERFTWKSATYGGDGEIIYIH